MSIGGLIAACLAKLDLFRLSRQLDELDRVLDRLMGNSITYASNRSRSDSTAQDISHHHRVLSSGSADR